MPSLYTRKPSIVTAELATKEGVTSSGYHYYPGDYIVRSNGYEWPVEGDVFHKLYEPVLVPNGGRP